MLQSLISVEVQEEPIYAIVTKEKTDGMKACIMYNVHQRIPITSNPLPPVAFPSEKYNKRLLSGIKIHRIIPFLLKKKIKKSFC